MSKKIRTLTISGIALLLVGISLAWAAEPLSTEIFNRSESGYLTRVDEGRMRRIEFVGDKVSLLGIAVFVVGAAGWMTRKDAE